jgi:hypothetical protein
LKATSAHRSSTSRPRKPEPEARGPDRSWGNAHGANGKAHDRVSDDILRSYRVVEENLLRQGERVARAIWTPFEKNGQSAADPSRLFDRAVRSAQDLAGAFSEIVSVLARTATAPLGGGAPSTAAPNRPAAAHSARAAVTVSVRSRRPVSVSIDLSERQGRRPLLVPPLTRRGPSGAKLRGISIVSGRAGAGPVVRIAVPATASRGAYEGPVIDARTKKPVGTIRVDVGS